MTVKDLASDKNFKALSVPMPEREITDIYIGDLLSWVMGRAKADSAWITIMSNNNVIAVATLSDVSCIILAEDVCPDESFIQTSFSKGVNLFSSPLTAYEIAVYLHGAIK